MMKIYIYVAVATVRSRLSRTPGDWSSIAVSDYRCKIVMMLPVSITTRKNKILSVQFEVPLIRVRDASSIVGSLVTMTIKHLNDFKLLWREQLRTSADEDQYWEQKQRIYLAGGIGIYEGYAIECEQMTQGMMILQVRGYRSQVDPTRPIVYVHSLATAPWNRLSNPDPNGFRAVGSAMLRFARFRSEELDYGGLVGLHSLPTAKTFYRKMGMIDGGLDAQKENLTYFEWYRRAPASIEEYRIDEGIDSDD